MAPVAYSWFEIETLAHQWILKCQSTCKNITICPGCGTCSFSNTPPKKIQVAKGRVSLADAAEKNGISIHWETSPNCERSLRSRSVVVLLPDYIRRLLQSNQFHTQLLSIINISMSVQNTARTVVTGLLEKRSLLDNPLICWSKEDNLQCLSKEIAST